MSELFPKPKRIDLSGNGLVPEQKARDHAPKVQEEALRDFAKKVPKSKEILVKPEPSFVDRALSWLMSVSAHVVLMILLALILFPTEKKKIAIEAVFSDRLGDQLEVMTFDEGNVNPTPGEEYSLEVPKELRVDDMLVYEKEELPFVDNVAGKMFEQSRIEITDMLAGRTDPGTKNDLLSKYGGNTLTIEAVKLGLKWLARQQSAETGAWSLTGPYRDGRHLENRIAATGLALLPFEGDGHTRTSGEYKQVVRKGWQWLLKQQKTDGGFYEVNADGNDHFYGHAICTIALCELLAMEQRYNGSAGDLKYAAERAVHYLLDNQDRELGGWRYVPKSDSDLSVTGWCLMALQTAKMARLDVPQQVFDRISGFLDKVAYDEGSQYSYHVMGNQLEDKRISMTATGLLCRMYLGWDRKTPAVLRGADILILPENLIRFVSPTKEKRELVQNVYGWYSASMALKHLGPYSKYWRTWNKAMCEQLPTHQEQPGSREAGSWNPQNDEFGFAGGRLYVTSLSILCLEVYYRHLGLFR